MVDEASSPGKRYVLGVFVRGFLKFGVQAVLLWNSSDLAPRSETLLISGQPTE